ncbi:MAG TPA: MFS transporter [Solirubrobacteraceae bacterium]|nr:MFS transporter [Solirubrobacteraceae bacterium]
MRDVLRLPGAKGLFFASCVARLPMGAIGLLLVLHTQHLTGSYAKGGGAAAAYALALGLTNPLLARLVDRRGQTAVLLTGAPLEAAAFVALALMPHSAPFGAIVACAIVGGGAQPPIGACMRALWPALIDTADGRHAAYALEATVLEVVYILGPVAIAGGIGHLSIAAALVTCAACAFAGNVGFARQGLSRRWRPRADVARDLVGPLRGRGVLVLVAVFALCGLAVGAVEVVVPAALTGMHHRALTGPLLGLWGVGSMIGGLAAGRLRAARTPARRLALLLAGWGAGHALIGAGGSPLALALLLLLAGATIAPTFVCANNMLDGLAPAGTLTEAFTWTSTGMTAGVAAGSALAGVIVDSASAGLAMAVLGGGGVLAALVVRGSSQGALRTAAPVTSLA